MSKLKKLSDEDIVDRYYDDPYHCCRWCHWSRVDDPFEGRKCYYKHHETVEPNGCVQDVYRVAEEGLLSQALEEVLNSQNLSDRLMYSLMDIFAGWKLSNKRRAEFMEHFREVWGEFADFSLKEKLDEKVSVLYQSKVEEFVNEAGEGFVVSDDFCCKYFE